MLTPTWLWLVTQTLKRLELTSACRVAVLGVGNELNGDDGIGVIIANRLAGLCHETKQVTNPPTLIISAGLAPENFTGQLRQFKPGVVILVDAAEIGARPGTITWLSGQDIFGMSASTHSLPLSILAKYLTAETGCEVFIIGIQAANNDFGDAISDPAALAAKEVIQGLGDLLFPRV